MIMALPFLFTIQSCKKDNESTSTATLGSATITGRVTGDLDLLNGKIDPVAGIKVIAKINMSDLVAVGSAPTNSVKIYEATTDADGNYTIKLDAGIKMLNVTLSFPAKANLEQTREDGSKQTVEYTVTSPSRSFTLYKGENRTENAVYTFKAEPSYGFITLRGHVQLRDDLCEVGDDQLHNAPKGTIIVINWQSDGSLAFDREMEVEVDADGNYSAKIETKESNKTFHINGRKFYDELKEKNGPDCVTNSDYGFTTSLYSINVNKGETMVKDIEFN